MYYNQKLEEFETYLRNKKVAIIGMGVSNAPLIEYLKSFSCDLTVFDKREEEKIDPTILKKIKERDLAKKEKNYVLADAIRDDLFAKNIVIKDTREGTTFEVRR